MIRLYQKYIAALYLGMRLYTALITCILLFIVAFIFPNTRPAAFTALVLIMALFFLDYILMFSMESGLHAVRELPRRLSNGEDNGIRIFLENRYRFSVNLGIIDELPPAFQVRDLLFHLSLPPNGKQVLTYQVRPTARGEYSFGRLNIYVGSPLSLVKRRFWFEFQGKTQVYPSFLKLRSYSLMAAANRLNELGIKQERRKGHSMEFDQIKEYIPGDDIRTLNWKASARKGQLMVNQFREERAQQVYAVIDKGRLMKMPFDGMTLLDHSINSALVLLHIVLVRQDRAGLITFSEKPGIFLAADRRPAQMNRILEALYKQKTRFLESDFERLYFRVRAGCAQRSLLLLFTNFETLQGMKRQLPSLKALSSRHLLIVVIFENPDMKAFSRKPAGSAEQVYIKTIAGVFNLEKKLISLELGRNGIGVILTKPENLTTQVINKYLELKATHQI
ncbi:MAG TPA: DUF58 domain-containing protein [Chitinophagaceae bacterium]|nr:DUF58 domain-containing protein [Chitinophagaceae bacterium]